MMLMLRSLCDLLAHEVFCLLALTGLCVWLVCSGFRCAETQWVKRTLLVLGVWWVGLCLINEPHGFNYDIYSHNADITLSGRTAYGRAATPADGVHNVSPRHPLSHDYTGAQHLVYVALRMLDLSVINWRLSSGFGFQLWTALHGILVILLIFSLHRDASPPVLWSCVVLPCVVLVFHPAVSWHWLVLSWEDKMPFLSIPLLFVFLFRKRLFRTAAVLLGVTIVFNGCLVFALPVFIAEGFRRNRRQAFVWAGLVGLGLLLGSVPFFPNSIHGWLNRASIMESASPWWFSCYLLLPEGWYSSTLNKTLTLIIMTVAFFGHLRRKLSLEDAVVISVSLVLLLGPYTVPSRSLPAVLLAAMLIPVTTRRFWLFLSLALCCYLLIGTGYSPANIRRIHAVVCWLPALFVFGCYVQSHRAARIATTQGGSVMKPETTPAQ